MLWRPRRMVRARISLDYHPVTGFLVACIIASLKHHTDQNMIDWWPAPLLFLLGFSCFEYSIPTFKAARLNSRSIIGLLSVVSLSLGIGLRFSASIAIVALMGAYLAAGILESFITLLKREHVQKEGLLEGRYDEDEEELID